MIGKSKQKRIMAEIQDSLIQTLPRNFSQGSQIKGMSNAIRSYIQKNTKE